MPKFKDITGQRYGQLTVVEFIGHRGGRTLWGCVCDCGKTVQATQNALQMKHVVSCGCKRRAESEAPHIAHWFGNLRRTAGNREKSFNITAEYAAHIAKQACHYCGAVPKPYLLRVRGEQRNARRRGYEVDEDYLLSQVPRLNGLDRVDNAIGYEEGNLVACCKLCNAMKSALTVDEFLQHVAQISAHQAGVKLSNLSELIEECCKCAP